MPKPPRKRSPCFAFLDELPTGVYFYGLRLEFSQDSDSEQGDGHGQTLTIEACDAGAGSYPVISTQRWAMDYDKTDWLANAMKGVCGAIDSLEDVDTDAEATT